VVYLLLFSLERTGPTDVSDTTLNNLVVDMLYSHDLFFQIFWVGFFFNWKISFGDNKIGLLGSALVVGHFVLDLFPGHPHHVFGIESQDIALGLYATNPFLAIVIVAVLRLECFGIISGKKLKMVFNENRKIKHPIIGLFVFGIVFIFSIATTSCRELFGIPEFDIGFNSNVPTLIMTCLAMIFYLNYFVPQFTKTNKN